MAMVKVKNMLESNLKFYTVTDKYINFMRKIDNKVQKNYPKPKIRPYIGTVLTIGIHQYFAPLSSYKPAKHDKINNNTIFKVYSNLRLKQKLAVIQLNNMFPVITSEIMYLDFSTLPNDEEGRKYRDLLQREYRYILAKQNDIRRRAKKLYDDVTKKHHPFYSRLCCDFALLEKEYTKFVQ